VRRRAQDGQATYYLTRKIETEGDGRLEEERRISPGEYLELLEGADPERAPINKTRFCFAYESFYFEMDALLREDGSTLWVLEIETPGPQVEIIMPPGIDVLREVTDDPQFRNSYLARQTELDS
jgi:CYTH domain-containing protein